MRKKKNVGVTRATAAALLEKLVERARQINGDTRFLYGVTRIHVFGSYLTEKPKLGDIDIAVELGPRCKAHDEHAALCVERREQAPQHFDFLGRLFWPNEEVLRALKNRHRAFSIHDIGELYEMNAASLEIFFDPAFVNAEKAVKA